MMSSTIPRSAPLAWNAGFNPTERARFERDGYVVVRNFAPAALRERILAKAREQLAARLAPLEYESDVAYPGAPASRSAPGGEAVRRLLQAYARDEAFQQWATYAPVLKRLRQLLGEDIVMPQAHHNCVMTKHPRYGSATLWHQDTRYWAYTRPELVNVWLALGAERRDNGGLRLLPGTHRMEFSSDRLDDARFLREDAPANRALIASEVCVELRPGDVLFFHAHIFHAAGQNLTDAIKYSLVYTYRPRSNRPLPNTLSSSLPDIELP